MDLVMRGIWAALVAAGCVLLAGCETTGAATRYHDPEACSSLVIGQFDGLQLSLREGPYLVLGRGRRLEIVEGWIEAVTADSVYFDPNRTGITYDPPLQAYALDRITALVDSNAVVIAGRLPDDLGNQWSMLMRVRPEGEETFEGWDLYFPAGRSVSYCLTPARYEVTSVTFWDKHGRRDRSIGGPFFTFEVEEGVVNDLGTWGMNDTTRGHDSALLVPTKTLDQNQSVFVFTSPFSLGLSVALSVAATTVLNLAQELDEDASFVHVLQQDQRTTDIEGIARPAQFVSIDVIPMDQGSPNGDEP